MFGARGPEGWADRAPLCVAKNIYAVGITRVWYVKLPKLFIAVLVTILTSYCDKMKSSVKNPPFWISKFVKNVKISIKLIAKYQK